MSQFREKPATIDDLAVANFRSKLLNQDICDWFGRSPVAMAESCNRQVWFGDAVDFASFPRPAEEAPFSPNRSNARVEHYTGGDAYAFLLRLITGIDSVNEGETNIAGQFYPGWDRFTQAHPHRAQRFDRMIQHLRADSALIRSEFIEQMRAKRHEMAARTLSGQSGGDTALVIGSLSNNNILSSFTAGILKALGNNRKNRADEIILTHPDPATAEILVREATTLHQNGYIKSALTSMPFSELGHGFERADCVFIDLPMRQNPDADRAIIHAWQNRLNTANTLTHMRGEPANRGLSSPEWPKTILQNYTSPEDIRAEMVRIEQQNKALRARAIEAIGFCTEMRQAGRAPSRYLLRCQPAAEPAPAGHDHAPA